MEKKDVKAGGVQTVALLAARACSFLAVFRGIFCRKHVAVLCMAGQFNFFIGTAWSRCCIAFSKDVFPSRCLQGG